MKEATLLKRVIVDPKVMLGKPVIKGTRLPVEIIVEKVAYGATLDDLRHDYPFLTADDVRAARCTQPEGCHTKRCMRLEGGRET